MVNPHEFYTFNDDLWASVAGTRPPLFYFFEGFMDAGNVGANLTSVLLEHCSPQILASFDVDLTHDFRARRPKMVFDTDSWKSVDEIALTLHLLRDARDTPFLVLSGPEPDMAWNGLRSCLIELFARLEVPLAFTAHGVPMAVPHTRPVPLTTHATDIGLRGENPRWVDRLTIPASFAAYLEFGLGQAGRRAMGIAAHVPHYLAQGNFVRAAQLIAERMAEATGLSLPVEHLRQEADANLAAIDAELHGNPEAAELIATLERQYDEFAAAADAQLPSAEELGAAVEAFLAEQESEDPNWN